MKKYNDVAASRWLENTFARFDTMHERDRHQTDRRTDTTRPTALMEASRGNEHFHTETRLIR